MAPRVCVEHRGLVASPAQAVALRRGGHSVFVAQRANAPSLCVRSSLSGRMKLMRFQFGFAVNRGTICKQMTEWRESGRVCSWILTEVHPSLQTTANNTGASTRSSAFSSLRDISHVFPSFTPFYRPFPLSHDLSGIQWDLEFHTNDEWRFVPPCTTSRTVPSCISRQNSQYNLQRDSHVHACRLARAGSKSTCAPC